MDYTELLAKYQALLIENNNLKAENKNLRTQLGIFGQPMFIDDENAENKHTSEINQNSAPMEKIELFMSIFKGRDDVYAKRWENKKKGTAGYSPFCLNEWKPGLCAKPKGTCAGCTHKAYAVLDEKVVDDHLRGRDNFVAGIYPLRLDETCCFLAIDFDDGEWQKDISVLREV